MIFRNVRTFEVLAFWTIEETGSLKKLLKA